MKACRFHLTVDRSDIIYLNAVLDSYEGLGIMRTEDESAGKVVIYAYSAAQATVQELLEALIAEGLCITVDKIDGTDKLFIE